MRKVTVELKVKLVLSVDSRTEVSEVIDELGYDFSDNTGNAEIEDSSIEDYEILDSR